jgi:septal ring factor EnvC (AmiA/AmiB activator)
MAASFKSYAAFKQEVAGIFAETERVRQENAALSGNLKAAVVQADEARAAIGQLEKELRAEQKARAEADKAIAQLREQLRAVARAVSAAGLNVEKMSGTTEPTAAGKR